MTWRFASKSKQFIPRISWRFLAIILWILTNAFALKHCNKQKSESKRVEALEIKIEATYKIVDESIYLTKRTGFTTTQLTQIADSLLLNSKDLYELGIASLCDGITNDAVDYFGKAAAKDNVKAMVTLGQLYRKGNYIQKDIPLAIKFYKAAVRKNNSMAHVHLASTYLTNEEYTDSTKVAHSMLYKAIAIDNNSDAMYLLGNIFREGLNVKPDSIKAFQYYKTAADLGHCEAMNNLGNCYLEGYAIDKNHKKASEIFEKSWEYGSFLGLYNLAELYRQGKGVKKDVRKATILFAAVISKDDEHLSGLTYAALAEIQIENHNYELATKLLRISSDKGNINSTMNLAHLLLSGPPQVVDIWKAYDLFDKALQTSNSPIIESDAMEQMETICYRQPTIKEK